MQIYIPSMTHAGQVEGLDTGLTTRYRNTKTLLGKQQQRN